MGYLNRSPRLINCVSLSMEGNEGSVLDAIYEDEETLEYDEEDIEMVDADVGGGGGDEVPEGPGDEAAEGGGGSHQMYPSHGAGKKKKNKKKKRRRNSGSAPNITDINRFVIDTCRRLKEKKSYLVWNAIGCLGVSAIRDLVQEVDVIQRCGGQMTADGSRLRKGGGILWNILKTREPKAYKEIMTKGRDFEKQLWQPKKRQKTDMNEPVVSHNTRGSDEAAGGEVFNSSDHLPEEEDADEPSDSNKERISVRDRMRVPVSYDDLFEEGEIHE